MKYRKKPVVIDAVQFTTGSADEVAEFVGRDGSFAGESLYIDTWEGVMTASIGDYIIKGVKGEFYPCKPDIFHQTYEAVEG